MDDRQRAGHPGQPWPRWQPCNGYFGPALNLQLAVKYALER